MSLINQMLQDLDRRLDVPTGVIGAAQVRVVEPQRSLGLARRALLLLLICSAVIGIGYWLWTHDNNVARSAGASLPIVAAPAIITAERSQPTLSTLNSELAAAPLERAPELIAPPPLAIPAVIPATNLPVPSSPPSRVPPQLEKPPAAMRMQAAQKTSAENPPLAAIAAGSAAEISRLPPSRAVADSLSKQPIEATPARRAEDNYRRATQLAQQPGASAEAIAALEQALQLDPQHVNARQTLVALLMTAKRADDAIRCLQEGLKLDPAQSGFAMILARLQLEKKEPAAALETLQRGLPHALQRADYQAFLAALLQRQGSHANAIEHYLAALRLMPENGVWWMGLGMSLQAEKRLTDAREAYGRAQTSATLTPELQAFVEQKLAQL